MVTGSEVVLTVVHVYDRRPEAASLLNLAAICRRCHNRDDAEDRQASRRMRCWLASSLCTRRGAGAASSHKWGCLNHRGFGHGQLR